MSNTAVIPGSGGILAIDGREVNGPESKMALDESLEVESIVQPGHFVLDYQLPPELPGTLTWIGFSLSDGAFGDVYRGIWSQEGSPDVVVAIKCIKRISVGENERFMTRIRRETVIWQAARHPNILPFLGYQIADGIPMLVSPWCENGNLAHYVTKHPELTDGQKFQLLSDAARGLGHLHSLKPPIAHGDIKPENIVITDHLEATLCDFGVSRVIVSLGTHTGLTTSGASRGTAGYQAKEIIDELPLTTMSDIYAFGGVILATLSGKRPFYKMKNDTAIAVAVYMNKTPCPADHPTLPETDPLWKLLVRCWDPVPELRPTVETLLQQLLEQMELRRYQSSPTYDIKC